MRILVIGDIIGKNGVEFVRKHLNSIKKLNEIDFCIANGENSASGNGISKEAANSLIHAGVDVITLGNHAFNKKDVFELLEGSTPIIRPANYPAGTAGEGYIEVDTGKHTVCVINALGRVNLDCLDCPFMSIDKVLSKIKNTSNVIIVDFHAEATSEKIAMGYYLDGRVSAIVGTHTHVQTADERILSGGTAYITDIGMTGPIDSVIGVKKEIIVKKFLSHIHHKFEVSENPIMLSGVIINVDESTGRSNSIERINIS